MHIPPATDPRWHALLASEEVRIYHNLGVQMAVARFFRESRVNPSSEAVAKAVNDLSTLFQEQSHLPSVHQDLIAIFGKTP